MTVPTSMRGLGSDVVPVGWPHRGLTVVVFYSRIQLYTVESFFLSFLVS